MDACKQAVKAAKEELQRKMRLLTAAQQEQQRMEARIKQLEEEIADRDKRVSKLQRHCQAKDATAAELQEEVRELKVHQTQAKEKEDRAKLDVEELRGVLTRSQREATELHDAVMAKELLIAALRREKSEAEKELSESRVLCERQADELQMWRRKEQETQSTIAHTLSQLEDVKLQLSSCQAERGQNHTICRQQRSLGAASHPLAHACDFDCDICVQLTCNSAWQRQARNWTMRNSS